MATGHRSADGGLSPIPGLSDHFGHDLRPTVLRGDIPLSRLDDGSQARAVVGLVEIQDMLGLVEVGIEVERGRQAPPRRGEEESVVA
jgi:hypothetical protein